MAVRICSFSANAPFLSSFERLCHFHKPTFKKSFGRCFVNKRTCTFPNLSKCLQHVHACILKSFERFILIRDCDRNFDIAILVIIELQHPSPVEKRKRRIRSFRLIRLLRYNFCLYYYILIRSFSLLLAI